MAAELNNASTEIEEVYENVPFIDDRGVITFVARKEGICVFDEKDEKIVIAQKYENEEMCVEGHTYCYHRATKQIFIFDGMSTKLLIYNVTTKQWRTQTLDVDIGLYACCVCVGDCVHICGGGSNKHHLMYDIKSGALTKSKSVELQHEYRYASMVADAKRNTIYVIGGRYLDGGYKTSSCIFEIASSKIKHIHQMPKALSYVGCILYDPYILIFGGVGSDNHDSDDIYSFNIYTHEWMHLSKHKLPFAGWCHAILSSTANAKTIHLFKRIGARHHAMQLSELLPEHCQPKQELMWSCSNCTLQNAATNTECEACGAAAKREPMENDDDRVLRLQQQVQRMQIEFEEYKRAHPQQQQQEEEKKDDNENESAELKSFLTDTKYKINLLEYYRNFKDEGFDDFDILNEVHEADLDAMNITKRGHRKKILRGVEILKLRLRMNNNQEEEQQQQPPQIAFAPPVMYDEFGVEGNEVLNTRNED